MKRSTAFAARTVSAIAAMIAACSMAQPTIVRAEETPLEAYAPADYHFTARLNVRKLFDAPETLDLRQKITGGVGQGIIDMVQMGFGVNLATDIDTLVLVGNPKRPGQDKGEGVILLRGRMTEYEVTTAMSQLPSYEAIAVGNRKIHGFWSEKDQEMRYVAFLVSGVSASAVAVMGERAHVEAVVTALDQKKPRLMDNPQYASRLRLAGDTALAVMVTAGAAAFEDNPAGRFLGKYVSAASLTLDLNQGWRARLDIDTPDAENAALMRKVIDGAVALGQMVDEKPALQECARKARVSSQGSTVSVGLELSADEARTLIEQGRRLGQGGGTGFEGRWRRAPGDNGGPRPFAPAGQ